MSVLDKMNFTVLNVYKKDLVWLLLLSLSMYLVLYLVLGEFHYSDFANRWLIQALIVLLIIISQTVKRLERNRLKNNYPLYQSLGWGNRLTIIRGVLIAALAGFLFLPWPQGIVAWVPGVIYCIAAIIDRIDGFVARITQMQSILGTELDTVFDAIGLLVAPLLAVAYGQLHWSYLLVSASYYIFHIGILFRQHRGKKVYALSPNLSRRAMAGFQMGFVAVVLFPIFQPPITQVAGFAFMVPVLMGFITDWLIVRGSLSPGSAISKNIVKVKILGKKIFLPSMRLLIFILMMNYFIGYESNMENSIQGTESTLIFYLSIFAMILIVTGLLGRTGAILLAILLGLHFEGQDLSLHLTILLFFVIWIMMLGTGNFSLYSPDEEWVNRYDGA